MQVSQGVLIGRSADEVWQIVGPRFGDVATWASVVDVSRPIEGAGPGGASCTGRACTVAVTGFAELTEELTAYDDTARTLTYRATSGMPGFVREARNTWTVEEMTVDTCAFTMRAEIDLSPLGLFAGPVLRVYLSRIGRRTCSDLKAFVETGRPIAHAPRGVLALRTPVTVNAAFSTLTGVLLMGGSDWWARQLGIESPALVIGLGLALAGYGLGVALLLGRGVGAQTGKVLAGLDAAWVVGTGVLLVVVGDRFTSLGLAAVVGTSAVVAGLGSWQWRATDRPVPRTQSLPDGIQGAV